MRIHKVVECVRCGCLGIVTRLRQFAFGTSATEATGIAGPASAVRMVALCGLLLALAVPSVRAQQTPQQGVWGAAPGVDPCGSEVLLEQRLAQDPTLRRKLQLSDSLAREVAQKRLLRESLLPGSARSTTPLYVIPVAVHIVHSGGSENISDAQVLSQIDALSRDFRNLLGDPLPAVDTRIEFCLATNLPLGSPVTWSTTPGITRTNSSLTNHTFNDPALKAIDYLPADRYLNIWVVKSIAGGDGGILGYSTFPGASPLALDGIVIRYDVFGSNSYGSFQLLTSNDDGKILAHEVGHYLSLFHTFHLGCTDFNTLCNAQGDCVADTPPEKVRNVRCPPSGPQSCTAAPDPIENFMDYTDDRCRWAFTNDQTTRMHTAIVAYRSLLVSADNLDVTGCDRGLNALIRATPGQVCEGGTVLFETTTSGYGYTYEWSFQGGDISSATTQTASVTYATAGSYPATLIVTDGGTNYSINTTTIYVVDCTPITGPCATWVWSQGCQLDFATGLPIAVNGTQIPPGEAGTQISDNSGNLLFYSNAEKVWDKNNNVMPNGTGILGGKSSHNGAIIVPRPGSSTQYYLFTIRQFDAGGPPGPWVTTVDMALNGGDGDVVAAEKNVPLPLPGNPGLMLEGQTLVPHCNGMDWWYITHQWGQGANNKLYVTLVTSGSPGTWTYNAYPMGIDGTGNRALGIITASRDGSKLAVVNQWKEEIRVYDFDRSTGVPTPSLGGPPGGGAFTDVAFSPSGDILYYSYGPSGSPSGLRQWDLATSEVRVLGTSSREQDVELGPDGKVYVSMANQSSVGCINFPDNFNTFDANECGYNPSSIPLGSGTNTGLAFPNTLQMCSPGAQPAQFTYTVSNCVDVDFHALDCYEPYSWDFGDNNFGAGQDVLHTYANPGTYNVTLTATGANPLQQTQTLVLELPPVSIAGPLQPCVNPSNYSASAPPGCTYQWTISGGLPASATGNNVDVAWGSAGGTVTLVVTDPATGCTAEQSIVVAPANGAIESSFHPGPGAPNSAGLATAYDGDETLFYTVHNDNNIYKSNLSGDFLGAIPNTPDRGFPCGALSWDPAWQRLWAGAYDGSGDVYIIDPVSGLAYLQFTVPFLPDESCVQRAGFIDGLAFDANKETLWISDQASTRIYLVDAVNGIILAVYATPLHPVTGQPGCNAGIEISPGGCLKLSLLQLSPPSYPDVIVTVPQSSPSGPILDWFVHAVGPGNDGAQDLALDVNTLAPCCILWSNSTSGPNLLTSWQVECECVCYANTDINGDKIHFTVPDLIALIKYVNFKATLPVPFYRADLNADGYIDYGDVEIFQRYFVEGDVVFLPEYPVPVGCEPSTVRGCCHTTSEKAVRSLENCKDLKGTYDGHGVPCTKSVKIERTHNTHQGIEEEVSLTIENPVPEMGGFDFLIAYDASALNFISAEKGQLLEDCDWEYFTYRHGVAGNCEGGCPSGLLRIIAIADLDNGPTIHPSCFGPPDPDPHELARMRFYVTEDLTFEGQYIPIRFYWADCGDNTISSVDGNITYLDQAIYSFTGTLLWDEDDDDQFPEDARPLGLGAPDECLEGGGPDKPEPLRFIDYWFGGIDIIPRDSLDAPGDINLNGINHEVADAVLFCNYFIYGDAVWDPPYMEGQIAATDINMDGIVLTVADLVYLIRIITGDETPFPKLSPQELQASVDWRTGDGDLIVDWSSQSDAGALLLAFDHKSAQFGKPVLTGNASGLKILSHNNGAQLRVLIYGMERGVKISAGDGAILTVPMIDAGSDVSLTEVEAADYMGNPISVDLAKPTSVPREFALWQNIPNPFNASTRITFSLGEAGDVTLTVYDILGRKVATLADGHFEPGIHHIIWNARDDHGDELASGVYLYRIVTPSHQAHRKMVLLK